MVDGSGGCDVGGVGGAPEAPTGDATGVGTAVQELIPLLHEDI